MGEGAVVFILGGLDGIDWLNSDRDGGLGRPSLSLSLTLVLSRGFKPITDPKHPGRPLSLTKPRAAS